MTEQDHITAIRSAIVALNAAASAANEAGLEVVLEISEWNMTKPPNRVGVAAEIKRHLGRY